MSTELALLRNEIAELKRLILLVSDNQVRPEIEVVYSEPPSLAEHDLTPQELAREIARGNFASLHKQNKRRVAALKKKPASLRELST